MCETLLVDAVVGELCSQVGGAKDAIRIPGYLVVFGCSGYSGLVPGRNQGVHRATPSCSYSTDRTREVPCSDVSIPLNV